MNIKQKSRKKKNLDLTELDKKDIKGKQEKVIEKNYEMMKDSDLFVVETRPIEGLKEKLISNKTKRNKNSKVEERIIKQIKKSEMFKTECNVENKLLDIWDNSPKENKITYPNTRITSVKYPKVPLPHPGQSYNPSKDDLSNLLHKVVELNKKPEINEVKIDIDKKQFESEDEEEIENVFKVSNNPPVDELNRKTKTERNRKIKSKLNKIKNEQDRLKKLNKISLTRSIGIKRFEKERQKAKKEYLKNKMIELRTKKEKEELIKIGVIEDKDLLQDFQVRKVPLPLRKIKTNNNLIRDRFENIIKRDLLGEVSSNAKKRNRKLNKFKYKDDNNADYGFEVDDEKLKIIE